LGGTHQFLHIGSLSGGQIFRERIGGEHRREFGGGDTVDNFASTGFAPAANPTIISSPWVGSTPCEQQHRQHQDRAVSPLAGGQRVVGCGCCCTQKATLGLDEPSYPNRHAEQTTVKTPRIIAQEVNR
jgi:hypothetical protein